VREGGVGSEVAAVTGVVAERVKGYVVEVVRISLHVKAIAVTGHDLVAYAMGRGVPHQRALQILWGILTWSEQPVRAVSLRSEELVVELHAADAVEGTTEKLRATVVHLEHDEVTTRATRSGRHRHSAGDEHII